jgi:hypothetical protein
VEKRKKGAMGINDHANIHQISEDEASKLPRKNIPEGSRISLTESSCEAP